VRVIICGIAASLVSLLCFGCGASSEALQDDEMQELDFKETGPLMAPAREAPPQSDDEAYFGDETSIIDERVDPADALEPRSDLIGPEPERPSVTTLPPGTRAPPAEIGDPRLQAEPAKPDEERP